MKTLIINADDSSAKIFMELARKLNFKARILSKEEKEDAALLALMNERMNDEVVPVSKTYEILGKVK